MNIDFNLLRKERHEWPRSQLPPKPPKRRWIATRICRCGECRFYPLDRQCSSLSGEAVQLYVTGAR